MESDMLAFQLDGIDALVDFIAWPYKNYSEMDKMLQKANRALDVMLLKHLTNTKRIWRLIRTSSEELMADVVFIMRRHWTACSVKTVLKRSSLTSLIKTKGGDLAEERRLGRLQADGIRAQKSYPVSH
ncbi:MAG: hypothetical protein ACXV6K_08855 [Halobacteriota archaeon]